MNSNSSGDPNSSSSSSNNNTGAIIGGVIGGLALICILVGVVVYLVLRARSRQVDASSQAFNRFPERLDQHQTPVAEKIRRGGWGPSELPASDMSTRSPAELPGSNFR
jgi:hypothetical protein